MDPIALKVKDYILDEFLPDANPDELSETTPLVTGGILDSIASLTLAGFLEENYGIDIQAHEVSVDNLNTLSSIADLVRSKLED